MKGNLTNRMYIKLENRENQVCNEAWADDYREDFYVEFVKYITYCINNSRNATMKGFEKWFDDWWDKKMTYKK